MPNILEKVFFDGYKSVIPISNLRRRIPPDYLNIK